MAWIPLLGLSDYILAGTARIAAGFCAKIRRARTRGDEMITIEQYFQAKPHAPEHEEIAKDLLDRVNDLLAHALEDGVFAGPTCPNTGTQISGSKGGSGDGGFRLETATTGSAKSSHKEARAVDVYDPAGELDTLLDHSEIGGGQNPVLEHYGLYREAPNATVGWCHLTTRPPGSGRRTFQP